MENTVINGNIVGGNLVINGQTIYTSDDGGDMNVTSRNGKVYVNGVELRDLPEEKNITLRIKGNVAGSVTTVSGEVQVVGNVGVIKTTSGDVTVGSNVEGSVSTVSGDVEAFTIQGNVKTVSGDISTR